MIRRPPLRDLVVAHALIARHQPVTSHHVAIMAETSLQRARFILRRLMEQGYVRSIKSKYPNDPYYWVLGRNQSALAQLGEVFDVNPDAYASRRKLPGNLAHHLAVVALWVKITKAVTNSEGFRQGHDLVDAEIPRRLETHAPDLIFVVERIKTQAQIALLVEVDMNTQTPRVVAMKAQGYRALQEAGGQVLGCSQMAVLVSCPTARRRRRLFSRLVDEALPPGLLYLAVADQVSPANVLTKVPWVTEERIEHLDSVTIRARAESPIQALFTPIAQGYRP